MNQINKGLFLPRLVWASLLAVSFVYVSGNLNLVTDLSQFIPVTKSTDFKSEKFYYLLDEIEKGDAATLLMMEITAPSAEESATLSRALRKKLQKDNIFSRVNNGEYTGNSAEFLKLYNYRYILQETQFDQDSLEHSLNNRLKELHLGMGMALKKTLAHDPQNYFVEYLERFQQRGSPLRHHGVWFDNKKKSALLLARMNTEGFAMDKQAENLKYVRNIWQEIPGSEYSTLRLSGPATFAVATKNEIQKTTNRLAIVAGLFMILVFWAGYRSFRLFFIAGLPLGSAILGGLCFTNLLFGNIHGITVAFGITILGVCLDYPVHLFSHLRPGETAKETLHSIWPTLRIGVVTTVLGYLTMLNTGFTGLSQLAIFACSGLIIALLVTRWIVPGFISEKLQIIPVLSWVPEHAFEICSFRCRTILVLLMCAISFYVFTYSHQEIAWQKDIAALSPIPKAAREFDQHLRDNLGVPDVGHIFLVRGNDPEIVLQKTEFIKTDLLELKERGIASNIYSVTDQLPSQKRQKLYQAQLPSETALRNTLNTTLKEMPFKKGTFEAFVSDVQKSKNLKPLSIVEMKSNEITAALTQDMFSRDSEWISIIRLAGVKDIKALDEWISDKSELKQIYLNVRKTSSSLVSNYRDVAIKRLVLGALLILMTLTVFLRSARKALVVFMPVLLALLFSITTQVIFGTSLTIFHVLALLLVVGIGLDYSLFFQRPWKSVHEQKKHFHGVMISAASTIMAFAMLGFSGVPVMAAMGITVSLGIMASFVFAWLWITPGGKQVKLSREQQ